MQGKPRVGLFATCLMNLFRPNIGFASVKLLEDAGCLVEVPSRQTCCGQPGYNSGDFDAARALARQVIETFEHYDYIVGPSGSCMATIRHDYPQLFKDEPAWYERACAMAAKSYEILSFLVDVMKVEGVDAHYAGTVTYHDSCSGLRGLGIKGQPRKLLRSVEGLHLVEMEETEVCCGFGGTFAAKYPEISGRMVDDKLGNAGRTEADTLVGGDLGCLMNIAGRAARTGIPLRVFHTVEILAGMARDEGITGRRDD
ncbi:(Fe-S)-binding protein [Uliginosibacterium sp. sgz301328]|uniref:(Fe-S)-binding protein n=1 Tax=Uliginosibacterium sp. sgz301328 TaxID=3243764 RepID=UPI00359DBD60